MKHVVIAGGGPPCPTCYRPMQICTVPNNSAGPHECRLWLCFDCRTGSAVHGEFKLVNTADPGRAENGHAPKHRRADWRKRYGVW
jgi:hypothetical protein